MKFTLIVFGLIGIFVVAEAFIWCALKASAAQQRQEDALRRRYQAQQDFERTRRQE